MGNIRCLIADIPQIMLADVIRKITEKQSGIEFVELTHEGEDIPRFVKDHGVDVVILGKSALSVSGTLNGIFEASPQVIAVSILEDGNRVCFCVEDVGPKELTDLLSVVAGDVLRKK